MQTISASLPEFFDALASRISADDAAFAPDAVSPHTGNMGNLGKLLLNSWSAEYALRITPVVNDEDYLQESLHWTFPQAYYSVLFSARALLLSQGVEEAAEDRIARKIGFRVMLEHYPPALSFYATGQLTHCRVHRLEESERTISTKLVATRKHLLGLAANPNTAKPRPYQGYTSFFDVMGRLRISSNNRELERLTQSPGFDSRALHGNLVNVVAYVNRVHEAHVKAAVGSERWSELLATLPKYLKTGFLAQRHLELAGKEMFHA